MLRRPAVPMYLLLALLLPVAASAGPLPAPRLQPGTYVYTIPPGFDPPMIGRAGMAQIQDAAKRLHYPYYVVLIDRLPGGTEEGAAQAVDGLAEDWARDPRYQVGRSSIFLLSFQPRQYRFLAGAEWKARLGFEREAHAPYTDLFLRSVQGTPKDPKSGIIAMMQAVDAYLFDQTDPARVAARARAARKAEAERRITERKAAEQRRIAQARASAQRRLAAAEGSLDEQILRLEGVLNNPATLLPTDTRAAATSLARGRAVRRADQPAAMLATAADLRQTSGSLEAYVQRRQAEEERKAQAAGNRLLQEIAAGTLLFLLVLWRSLRYRGLRRAFQEQAGAWDEKVLNAKGRYVSFYGDHDTIRKLVDPTGETATLYASVTAEVDAIYLGVSAMETHVQECRALAQRGNALHQAPLQKALERLEGDFAFDTRALNPDDLFGQETKVVTVQPKPFFEELEERFRTTLLDWNRLKDAAEMRYTPAQDLFPSKGLDEMLATAEARGIPRRWLADHPLYGDDTSDKNLYDATNENRWNDPVAFAGRIGGFRAKEAEIRDRLGRLIGAQEMVRAERIAQVPAFPATVLRPDDDPRLTIESARREEDRFAGTLASRDAVEEVEEQAKTVRDLYRKCAEQVATVQSAIEGAASAIAEGGATSRDLAQFETQVARRLEQAQKIHTRVQSVVAALCSGQQHASVGRQDLAEAESLLAGSRHVEARRKAKDGAALLATARTELQGCLDGCDELDRQKAEFERKLEEMEEEREAAVLRMRRYGGSVSLLEPVQAPRYDDSALDYAFLLGRLSAQQSAWDAEVLRAQREYEEEQRREEEAAAEARRQQESSWSSSSSSGSGWSSSSSSSSSSGGSFGGGSSSSSGGSW